MTTLDLLLTLSGKIADALLSLLQRKMEVQEKEKVEQLIKQYNELTNTHTQLSAIVKHYNQGIVRAIATGSLRELFPLCTHNGYKDVETLYHSYNSQGVNQLLLDQLEILSVNLITHTIQELNFSSSDNTVFQRAQVYTLETWISSDVNGKRYRQEVINQYLLSREDTLWKIENAKVYTRQS